MVALASGLVVVVRFPFSDLSSSKLRPAAVLAHAGGADWVLCQITSNPYGDPAAIAMTDDSFSSGGLNRDSYARPGKLFTASATIVVRQAGVLLPNVHRAVVHAAMRVLQSGLQ